MALSILAIGAAAADVAGHGLVDLRVGRLGSLGEQRGGGHDLARLAIAALGDVDFHPGALDGMAAGSRKAFDGGDVLSGDAGNRGDAGPGCVAIDMDRTRAAQRHAAAEFGAGHVERVAKNPEQRHIGIDVDRCRLAVQCELSRHEEPSLRICSRRRLRPTANKLLHLVAILLSDHATPSMQASQDRSGVSACEDGGISRGNVLK